MATPSEADEAVAAALRRGRVAFMGLELAVAPGTLVPRAETEILATRALELLRDRRGPRVIDLCSGAGNLACAIAHHLPEAQVWASDLTEDCVELARRNAELCKVADRVRVYQGDLFAALRGRGLEGGVDAIVCNPPYISEKRLREDKAVLLALEPLEAFAAGPYGISIHQRVIAEAPAFLRRGGVLLVEVGSGQHRQVERLFERTRAYDRVGSVDDANGEPRVIYGYAREGTLE